MMKQTAYAKYLLSVLAIVVGALCADGTSAQSLQRSLGSFSAANVPTHLLTAIYGDGSGIRPTPNPSLAPVSTQAKLLTWAYSGTSGGADWISAYEANGVKTLVYVTLWRNYSIDRWYSDIAPGGVNANAEAKDCSGTPVSSGSVYLNDPRSAYSLRHADAVTHSVSSEYTAFFLDNGAVVGGLGSLPCNYKYNGNYIPATNTIDSQITNSAGKTALMFMNTINGYWVDNDGTNGWIDSTKLSAPSNVLGLMCEQCYLRHHLGTTEGKLVGSGWSSIENAEISMVQRQKIFWSYANSTCAPASSTLALDQRMYEITSLLLSYDPAYVMIQECFATGPSNFLVMPETQFVPETPLTTATSSVSTYKVAGTGLYARQFQNCYYKGSLVGPCAIVVNPSTAANTIPSAIYNAYTSRAVLVGSGVLDGGTVSFTGAKTPTVAPFTGEILITHV